MGFFELQLRLDNGHRGPFMRPLIDSVRPLHLSNRVPHDFMGLLRPSVELLDDSDGRRLCFMGALGRSKGRLLFSKRPLDAFEELHVGFVADSIAINPPLRASADIDACSAAPTMSPTPPLLRSKCLHDGANALLGRSVVRTTDFAVRTVRSAARSMYSARMTTCSAPR